MNTPHSTHQSSMRPPAWTEAVLGIGAALVGIYGLGQGLGPLFGSDHGGNILWLVPAVAALMVLAAQMGRVHDTWPHRPKVAKPHSTKEQTR